jgi:hypothetical protein
MPSELVGPRAERTVAAKPRDALPEVLAELGEDLVGAPLVAYDACQVAEDLRAVAAYREGRGRRVVAAVEGARDGGLDGIVVRGHPGNSTTRQPDIMPTCPNAMRAR